MIHTAKQLKDKVKNLATGKSDVAQMLIRIFIMERFLERVSLSKYKNNFILKGNGRLDFTRILQKCALDFTMRFYNVLIVKILNN